MRLCVLSIRDTRNFEIGQQLCHNTFLMNGTYTLSYAHIDVTETFTTAVDAGAAFKRAVPEHRPRVIFSDGKSAKLIATTHWVLDKPEKFVPKGQDDGFVSGYMKNLE
ncbi:hypothetical protein RLO149_c018880 [Roseobacter litoralis Och 149]|uniref:Uncharacterized protein n=2 Tax=Roseobacter litoralis TaxID=42443 RepID=F7ZJP5_ROSLO|nr:hypothetical protein RLO149_c018880 [Roseobacter litoralis Och 149]